MHVVDGLAYPEDDLNSRKRSFFFLFNVFLALQIVFFKSQVNILWIEIIRFVDLRTFVFW